MEGWRRSSEPDGIRFFSKEMGMCECPPKIYLPTGRGVGGSESLSMAMIIEEEDDDLGYGAMGRVIWEVRCEGNTKVVSRP